MYEKNLPKQYPEYVDKVLKVYEEARKMDIQHPDETAAILAKEAQISLDVAKKELIEVILHNLSLVMNRKTSFKLQVKYYKKNN